MGYFSSSKDYYCNEVNDLSWGGYLKNSKDTDGPLSAVEILKKEEAAMERDTAVKSNAMGSLPFEVLPDAQAALDKFKDAGQLLALSLEDEKIGVAPGNARWAGGLFSAAVADQPAFLFLRIDGAVVFVYFCPDEAKVRAKMTYSTAKASVVGLAAAAGFEIARVEEVRSVEDLDALAQTKEAEVQAASQDVKRTPPPGKVRPKSSSSKKKFVGDDE